MSQQPTMSQKPLSAQTGTLCVRLIRSLSERKQLVQVTTKRHGAAVALTRAAWLRHNLLDERADCVPCCRTVFGRQMHVEFGNGPDIQSLIIRRQAHDLRRWRCSDDLPQSAFFGFQILHTSGQCARVVFVLLNPSDEVGDTGAGLRQSVPGRGALDVSSLHCGHVLAGGARRSA